ncbi:DUF4399 domain-containing protein [Burkholderia gladioli]|uniref:DUF4399 domain-containing protein n=1 Tax=Burkholderia gladioli TaxID=28095 RepID=UPI0034DAE010
MNTSKRWMAGMLCASAFAAVALASSARGEEPRVYFVAPSAGATVSNPVHVKMGVEGMQLRPAGDMTPNTGHHHLEIDGGPIPKGEVIPASEHSLHFGKAQTETDIQLPPGKHTLTLQFGDGMHRSYGPAMSQTITVNVDH